MGLEGVEVYYPSHSPKAVKALLKMAHEMGLLITGGSDYHGMERAGYSTKEWLHKTHIPYDIVAAMKKCQENKESASVFSNHSKVQL